jgi:hypothetical protein
MFVRGLAKLALEVLGILGLVWVLAAATTRRMRPRLSDLRAGAVVAVGALAVVLTAILAIHQLASAHSTLNETRRSAVSARDGIEHCFYEQGAGARLPFIRWVKRQIGTHGVYALDYAGQPDVLCVYLVMLPALPAAVGQRADWTIGFGAIPPDVQSRIRRHDPAVRMFAPGFALQADRKP